ncbi:MAG: hypothetical protein Q7K13_02460 [Polynucleobacter sp.]|uniref:hypothetical protein n=1 Tax=Polynucleobacter sp. TaxID=2029855 RepID=UPI00271DC30F|nr:hypothetical protein [Polynucleobacter sp.]MDO8713327.1 hypothetical protein [Polynucleobacter sp.]
MKPEASTNPDAAVRILKVASCPSLSGKSTLTYHIGFSIDSQIQFRVHANTGNGFFSKEWISQSSIQLLLDKIPKGKVITSVSLISIFHGKSVNTSGFLLAVLKNEGLVQPLKDKRRSYELLDPKDFIAEVNALLESPVDLNTSNRSTASTPIKKLSPKSKPKKT